MTNSNQDMYKKRDALYRLQAQLADPKLTAEKQKELLEQQTKLEAELVDALKNNLPERRYCVDHKCNDFKQLTQQKHIKHQE